MKKVIIVYKARGTGTIKTDVVSYPDEFTKEDMEKDFYDCTFYMELIAINPYSEVDTSTRTFIKLVATN